ncbi:MAG: hypothetical protein H6741_16865 [Alphaproteobacteria bacterium]|nr:hypothetical protein [Alphaproteobacteria bacterium]MCB9794388.1 hypothetical protein [Alphaproteobacteria bacterium]
MNMRACTLLCFTAIGLGAGCEPETTYGGYDMVDHFPVDGQREWTFANESKGYDIVMNMGPGSETTMIGDIETDIKTFQVFFGPDGPGSGDLYMEMKWSSDNYNGVLIHGYEVFSEEPTDDGSGGDDTGGGGDDTGGGDTGGARGPLEAFTFSPPITFADRKMVPGESVVTETGGMTFTSTFVLQEDCENHLLQGELTPTCLKIELDDGDGDVNTGLKITGTYWIATRYVFSWIHFAGDDDKWSLAGYDWEPAE